MFPSEPISVLNDTDMFHRWVLCSSGPGLKKEPSVQEVFFQVHLPPTSATEIDLNDTDIFHGLALCPSGPGPKQEPSVQELFFQVHLPPTPAAQINFQRHRHFPYMDPLPIRPKIENTAIGARGVFSSAIPLPRKPITSPMRIMSVLCRANTSTIPAPCQPLSTNC